MPEPSPDVNDQRSLGEIELPNKAFELDLRINEGFQNYSAELLRIALLVISGVALVWLRLMFPGKDAVTRDLASRHVVSGLVLSFICLVVSAAAALLHRNTAAESLAYQLTALRLRQRNRPERPGKPSDEQIASKEIRVRNRMFRMSGQLLILSAAALICGVIAFGWVLVEVTLSPIVPK